MLMVRAELTRLFKNRSLILLIITFFCLSIFQCIYVSLEEDVRSLSNDIPVLETTDFSQSDDIYIHMQRHLVYLNQLLSVAAQKKNIQQNIQSFFKTQMTSLIPYCSLQKEIKWS